MRKFKVYQQSLKSWILKTTFLNVVCKREGNISLKLKKKSEKFISLLLLKRIVVVSIMKLYA